MKKRIFVCILVLTGLLASTGLPWPGPVSMSKDGQWTVNIKYEHPQQITLTLPGKKQPQRFWYMIISLTNQTAEEEVPFYPKCELATDTFQILPAGKGVHKELFELVKAKHKGGYPFLESLDFEDNQIRRGSDNTRDFVIFWPDFDMKGKMIHFYLAGLSNETAAIEHPIQKDQQGKPLPVYLRKTLQVTYLIGADPQLRQQSTLNYKGQDWVMR